MTIVDEMTWDRIALDHVYGMYQNAVIDKFKTSERALSHIGAVLESVSVNYMIHFTNSGQDTFCPELEYEGRLVWDEIGESCICLLGYMSMIPKPSSISSLLVSKQRDYGTKNISKFGTIGILIRLNDKIERLINLLNRANYNLDNIVTSVSDESIYDTITDIIGYCVIAKMWLNKYPDSNGNLVRQFFTPLP